MNKRRPHVEAYDYYREKQERREKQIVPIFAGTAVIVLLFALIAYSVSPQPTPPPPLDVEFHSDGQVSVYNPGAVPEAHVSLCVFSANEVLLEHFETPILAGHTGVVGPTVCPTCAQLVVLGPRCDKDAWSLLVARKVPVDFMRY